MAHLRLMNGVIAVNFRLAWLLIALAFGGCDRARDQPASDCDQRIAANAAAPSSTDSAFTLVRTFQTGLPVFGVSVVPATGHRGRTLISVAHGPDGVTVYNLEGEIIWTDRVRANLAVFSQGKLLVYTRSDGADSVAVYDRMGDGSFAMADMRSPPIPAATTLQRTALAAIGPATIADDAIDFVHHGTFKTQTRATAVAGARDLIPLTAGLSAVYGDTKGALHIVEIHAPKARLKASACTARGNDKPPQ